MKKMFISPPSACGPSVRRAVSLEVCGDLEALPIFAFAPMASGWTSLRSRRKSGGSRRIFRQWDGLYKLRGRGCPAPDASSLHSSFLMPCCSQPIQSSLQNERSSHMVYKFSAALSGKSTFNHTSLGSHSGQPLVPVGNRGIKLPG